MKTKKHSKEITEKVMEIHNLGTGCKIISKTLDIPVSTAESILRTWKLPHTTNLAQKQDRAR